MFSKGGYRNTESGWYLKVDLNHTSKAKSLVAYQM